MATVLFMHPWHGKGTKKPLPPAVRELVDSVDGKRASLEEFVAKLKEAAPGGEVSVSTDYVGLLIREEDGRASAWRAIRFEPVADETAPTEPAPTGPKHKRPAPPEPASTITTTGPGQPTG